MTYNRKQYKQTEIRKWMLARTAVFLFMSCSSHLHDVRSVYFQVSDDDFRTFVVLFFFFFAFSPPAIQRIVPRNITVIVLYWKSILLNWCACLYWAVYDLMCVLSFTISVMEYFEFLITIWSYTIKNWLFFVTKGTTGRLHSKLLYLLLILLLLTNRSYVCACIGCIWNYSCLRR